MNMPRGHSISRRLTLMNMAVSGTALLLACAAFFAYDLYTFRDTLENNRSIVAQIISANTTSALAFDDSRSAELTLSALKASPNILSATIFRMDGKLFAAYKRPDTDDGGKPPEIPPGQVQVVSFGTYELRLARLILLDGKPTGIVYIRSDLIELQNRLLRYAGIVAGVLVASLLAAWLISSLSRRTISKPIVHLASLANRVSKEKNYAVRATQTVERGELATLIGAFNEMLEQIQQRDAALQKAQEELENRVQERTAQLAAANKELEAFSYSVSHDLRAPLRHIDGFSSVLAQKYGPTLDSTAQQYLGRIREGAKHMGHLIDDLLNMARIGRQPAVMKPTDTRPLVNNAIDALKPEYEGRHIDWRIRPLPTVECDPGLMKIVFTNLLSNAVKYTRRKETATIEVGQFIEGGSPVIYVRDNGAGFEQTYADKLFGVFQRLHRAEDFEGTGVGLATVRRIIDKHGGRIWAQGKVDDGATFFFTLKSVGPNEVNHAK
jgi:signal transduction histidine kinase